MSAQGISAPYVEARLMETDGPDRALLSGAWHAHVSNHGNPLLDFDALTSRLNEVHTAWGTCAAPKKAAPRRAAPPPPRSHGAGLGGHTRAPSAPPPSAAARISAKPVVASARALGNVSDDTARNLGRATSFLCRHGCSVIVPAATPAPALALAPLLWWLMPGCFGPAGRPCRDVRWRFCVLGCGSAFFAACELP